MLNNVILMGNCIDGLGAWTKGSWPEFSFHRAKCVRTYLKIEDGRSIITKATLVNIKAQCSSPYFLVSFCLVDLGYVCLVFGFLVLLGGCIS